MLWSSATFTFLLNTFFPTLFWWCRFFQSFLSWELNLDFQLDFEKIFNMKRLIIGENIQLLHLLVIIWYKDMVVHRCLFFTLHLYFSTTSHSIQSINQSINQSITCILTRNTKPVYLHKLELLSYIKAPDQKDYSASIIDWRSFIACSPK